MANQLTADIETTTWFKPLLMATLAISALGNIAGLLFADSVYGEETDSLADAAIAQDAGTLAVCVATILLVGWRHRSGVHELIGLGVAGFLAYNAVIYCFDITFGPLFPIWTLVLGLSVFTLASGFRLLVTGRMHLDVARTMFAPIVMMTVAVLFSLLWLIEISSDLMAGQGSTSAATWQVPTNPVHVLDLAIALPTAFITGVAVLQRRALGLVATPAVLAFLIVMSIPIVLTPVASALRSHPAEWGAAPPVLAIGVLCAAALWHLVRRGSPGRS
jgi:hypothetical protein